MNYQIQVFFFIVFLFVFWLSHFFPFSRYIECFFFLERKKSNTNKTSTFFVHNPVNFFKYLSLFLGLRKEERKEGIEEREKKVPEEMLDEEKALHLPFFIHVSLTLTGLLW